VRWDNRSEAPPRADLARAGPCVGTGQVRPLQRLTCDAGVAQKLRLNFADAL
jgi:hypothetical protein